MPLPLHAHFGQGPAQRYSPLLSADASCNAPLAWQTCLIAGKQCQQQSLCENPRNEFPGAQQD